MRGRNEVRRRDARRRRTRYRSSVMRSLLATSLLAVAASCGGSSAPSATASAPSTRPGGPPHPPGPVLTQVLGTGLPAGPACLGFTPAGDGALVVTTRHDRVADDASAQVTLQLLMLPGATAPVELGATDVTARDAAACKAMAAALEPRLRALGMVGCEVQQGGAQAGWKVPHGEGALRFAEVWDATPPQHGDEEPGTDADTTGAITMAKAGVPPAPVRPMVCGAGRGSGDGGSHDHLDAIYYNQWAAAGGLVVGNSDTGLEQRTATLVNGGAP